ncbi:MAG: glycosyltransferase family 4 protein [Opitutales bacterium]
MAADRPDVLFFAPAEVGGLAEHVHYQASALHQAGVRVEVLCAPGFLDGREVPYALRRSLMRPGSASPNKWRRGLRLALANVFNPYILAWRAVFSRPRLVFFDSYTEYFSPLWIKPHWLLARVFGFRYGMNLHDPVRDYVLGPKWWHKLSVWLAYTPFSFGLIHQKLPDTSIVPSWLKLHEVPVGVYAVQNMHASPALLRTELNLPEHARVFLAFGFIRDNKNLDLFIRAMADFPQVHFVIAGRAQASKDKPVGYYKELAQSEGVADRVTFKNDFIPDEEIAALFNLADTVVLTYDASFHSQSGVINIAATVKKPVIASGGESPLKEVVQRFKLGEFVEPDSLEALKEGLRYRLEQADDSSADWAGYFDYASWQTNIQPLLRELRPSAAPANAPEAQPANARKS